MTPISYIRGAKCKIIMNVLTECLKKTSDAPTNAGEHVLSQTMHVRIASNLLRIQSFDQLVQMMLCVMALLNFQPFVMT